MNPLESSDSIGEVLKFCEKSYMFTGLVNKDFNSKFRESYDTNTSFASVSSGAGRIRECDNNADTLNDMYALYHAYCSASSSGRLDCLMASIGCKYSLSYLHDLHEEEVFRSYFSCKFCHGYNLFELAILNCNLDCARFIESQTIGFEISKNVMEAALKSNSIQMFQFVFDSLPDYKWDGLEMCHAILGGERNVEYVYSQDDERRLVCFIQYLKEVAPSEIVWRGSMILAAVRSQFRDVVRLLVELDSICIVDINMSIKLCLKVDVNGSHIDILKTILDVYENKFTHVDYNDLMWIDYASIDIFKYVLTRIVSNERNFHMIISVIDVCLSTGNIGRLRCIIDKWPEYMGFINRDIILRSRGEYPSIDEYFNSH